jgi:hypothetical protein
MRRALALVCLAGMLLPVACASAASPAPPRGTVAGRLTLEGGPLGAAGQQPRTRPIPGTVQFISGQHRRITVRVNGSGRFFVQLPPGRYLVSDRSPRLLQVGTDGVGHQTWSRPVPVTVAPHRTTKITLTTIVP